MIPNPCLLAPGKNRVLVEHRADSLVKALKRVVNHTKEVHRIEEILTHKNNLKKDKVLDHKLKQTPPQNGLFERKVMLLFQ